MKYQKLKRNLYTACVVANLFLIPSPVLWAEQSYAQSTRLSLELSNATISDVFASVEKNSEYRFFYSDAVRAELYRNVDVNIKNKTIDRILSEVLDGTNLTYFLNDRQVMIIRKEEKTQQEKKISINGTVRDAQQEPLPGVNVLVKGTTIGTTTDIDGNYFISVPDKNAVLVFSYIGFESQEVKVGGQININVNMSEESNSLDEVVVVGYGSQKRASVVGSITAIEPAQLQQGTTRAVSNNLVPRPQVGFQDVPTGIGSSYIFSLKPGDKVMMSGPYGDFHPNFTSGKEMIWIGGGAGMAPLRAQIMHMTKTLQTRDREMHFFYGARALGEAFFLEDFWELEKEFPNFHFHLSLDRQDPKADAAGVKYYTGFAVNCIRDTYLKDHEAPEDCEYYLCGPPMLIKTVTDYLDSLGVDKDAIMYDNFG